MASRDSYKWDWMRAQYERAGLSPRAIAKLHLATYGVKVSHQAISNKVEACHWRKFGKLDKVDAHSPNLTQVLGVSAETGHSGQFSHAREIAERQVFVLDRHRNSIGRLHSQIEKMLTWSDEIFGIVEEDRKLQKLLRSTEGTVSDRLKEMSSCLRVMSALRENTVDLTRALSQLIPLEREAYQIGTAKPGEIEEGERADMDIEIILALADELKIRQARGEIKSLNA